MHVRTKSQHPSYTHTSSVGKDVIIEDTNEGVAIKTHLPNRPKSARSIKDVQVSVVDGGSAITIQIHAGRQKMSQEDSATAKPHWVYDNYIPLGEDIKVGRGGMKTTLGKDGELTIVARKLTGNRKKWESTVHGNSNVKLIDL